MVTFISVFLLSWLLLLMLPHMAKAPAARRASAWLVCVLFGFSVILTAGCDPVQRLLQTTLGMLYVIKTVILLNIEWSSLQQFSKLGLLLYMTIWPGMDPSQLQKRVAVDEDGRMFVQGFITMFCGLLMLIAVSLCSGYLSREIIGWAGIVALLLTIHMGYANILTCIMRLCGWNVQSLFDNPLNSERLKDFWSKRWNRAFVEMNRILFMPALSEKLGKGNALLGAFVISGLLHELAISFPAITWWTHGTAPAVSGPTHGADMSGLVHGFSLAVNGLTHGTTVGGPTLYFLIQGLAFLLEGKMVRERSSLIRRVWTFAWLLIPLPLLFTSDFRAVFILPLVDNVRTLVTAHDLRWWFGVALWCAAAGNFCTMMAGMQAPRRLNWGEELCRLSSFNRKIFINYYGYIGLLVFSWGVLSLVLHQEMLDGERSALCIALLMGGFWGLRVLVDAFWFKHSDWPKGPSMVIGHTCLTALFCALTCTYLGLVAWHWVF